MQDRTLLHAVYHRVCLLACGQFYVRIRKYYTLICDVFDYYCTVGTGDPFSIQVRMEQYSTALHHVTSLIACGTAAECLLGAL